LKNRFQRNVCLISITTIVLIGYFKLIVLPEPQVVIIDLTDIKAPIIKYQDFKLKTELESEKSELKFEELQPHADYLTYNPSFYGTVVCLTAWKQKEESLIFANQIVYLDWSRAYKLGKIELKENCLYCFPEYTSFMANGFMAVMILLGIIIIIAFNLL